MCRKTVKYWWVALALTAPLGACTPTGVSSDGTLFTSSVKASDMALASLAKGDMAAAEGYVTRALHADDRDPYGLLAAGMLYQNTNRPTQAIQAYQTIVALNPSEKAVLGQWFSLEKRPLGEIAAANLEVIQMLPQTASQPQKLDARAIAAQPTMTAGSRAAGPTTLVSGGVSGGASAGMSSPPPRVPPNPRVAPVSGVSLQTAGDMEKTKVVGERFRTLKRLLDESLISSDEYMARRAANLGALLPLSGPLPSGNVSVPPPPSDEIVGRLNDLRATLRRGAITQDQFNRERTAILDALLAENPVDRRPITPVPTTAAGADAAAARLRALTAAGLISEAEATQEMNVLTQTMAKAGVPAVDSARVPSQAGGSPQPVAAGGAVPKGGQGSATRGAEKSATGSVGAHLASFRSEAEARQGGKDLQKRYPALLGTAKFQFQPVTISGKGTFIRLIAGPFDKTTTQNLCASLKRSGQYCVPTAM